MGRLLAGWMRANRLVLCEALRRMTVYRVTRCVTEMDLKVSKRV